MIPTETLALFFAASLSLALVPGPDNIFVLMQSAMHGRKAGFLMTLGLCTGLLLHTTAVCLGVAIIFQSSALAFTLLKLLGPVYLLYLAWLAFRAEADTLDSDRTVALSLRKLYYRGIIMNITNPKVAIFFLAFLPQFTDPSQGAIIFQMLLLGGLFIIATVLVFGGIAYFSSLIGEWLTRSQSSQIMINRAAGIVFTALAFRSLVN